MLDEPIIEVKHVTRRFRHVVALDEVSLTVHKGELFGVLGPDGSGKTTLLRMMAAVLNPSAGAITVEGFDTVKNEEDVKAHIGYMPQRFGLYGDLSVAENLGFVADLFDLRGAVRQERLGDLYEFTQLEPFKTRPAEQLSGGMKKKLGLACALLHRPDVLLLDEPTTGVDPVTRRGFWDLLSGLHAQGATTVVSTPYMDEAERCNRVALLFQGRILACDTPQNIKATIPGTVIALEIADIRCASDVLTGLPFLLDIQPYGDQLNVIVSGEPETARRSIHERLAAENLDAARLEAVPIRMEEAFIYLVKTARREVG